MVIIIAASNLLPIGVNGQSKDEKVLTAVEAVKEVQQLFYRNRLWHKQHPGHNYPRPAVIIKAKPTAKTPYYQVGVGVNDSLRLVPGFNFYVLPHTYVVKYYDVITDSVLTLKEWRHRYRPIK